LRRVGLANDQTDNCNTNSSEQKHMVESNSSEVEKNYDSESSHGSSSLTLDSELMENGTNISQGQRSLISIARALVRRARIVILDEATASIDGRADTELQVMLRDVMKDATVLIVAHRIDTIMSTCDKVVVMDGGRVAEFGTISELYSRPDGLFRALCDVSKITVETTLKGES
jgi:ABC-type multidrug transport system fused ATPase/permease subunit